MWTLFTYCQSLWVWTHLFLFPFVFQFARIFHLWISFLFSEIKHFVVWAHLIERSFGISLFPDPKSFLFLLNFLSFFFFIFWKIIIDLFAEMYPMYFFRIESTKLKNLFRAQRINVVINFSFVPIYFIYFFLNFRIKMWCSIRKNKENK